MMPAAAERAILIENMAAIPLGIPFQGPTQIEMLSTNRLVLSGSHTEGCRCFAQYRQRLVKLDLVIGNGLDRGEPGFTLLVRRARPAQRMARRGCRGVAADDLCGENAR